MNWIFLLIAYALCFGIQNKMPFRRWHPFLEAMIKCTYCLGFHCGWLVWLAALATSGSLPPVVEGSASPTQGLAIGVSAVSWSLASAAFCYAFDAAVQWLETRSA